MADVFISYSRKDIEFVRLLYEALRNSSIDAWVDWMHSLSPTNWWQSIEAGIEAADNFIFIITPNSIASKFCEQEIEHAVKHNKRIIALLRREDFDNQQIPPALVKQNLLVFRESDDFDREFQTLLRAIDTQ
jgi:hypothetical protein